MVNRYSVKTPICIQDFINITKRYKVFCFGAGIQGRRMIYYFENWGIEDCLLAYVDNSASKVGTHISGDYTSVQVISIDEMVRTWDKDTIILITSLYYKEIREQLHKILPDAFITSYAEISDAELEISDYDHVVKESDTPLIPKIIHYVWVGGEKPESVKKNVSHWKELCPDYEFIEWNEKNYDIKKNKYMYQAYKLKKYGFFSDFLRLDVLYEMGGIYLDTDIEMIKRPDELVYQKCFGCVDTTLTLNTGSGFGCVPGMDIIREFRDYYNDVNFVNEDGSINMDSCNTHQLRVLYREGYNIDDTLQNIQGMNIYPMIFQGKNAYTGREKITDKTFWIHHGNMSWMDNMSLNK